MVIDMDMVRFMVIQFNLAELVSTHILVSLIMSLLKVFSPHFAQIGLAMRNRFIVDWLQGIQQPTRVRPQVSH